MGRKPNLVMATRVLYDDTATAVFYHVSVSCQLPK